MTLTDKTIVNILAKSGEALLLLISSVVMVRVLSKEDYGTFLQIMLVVNTAIMFSYFGLPQSIFYFFQKSPNKKQFLIVNLLISIIIGVITALIVLMLTEKIALWLSNHSYSGFGIYVSVLIFLRGIILLRDPLLIASGNLILNSFSIILSNLLFYGAAIIVCFFRQDLYFIITTMIFAALLDALLYLSSIVWMLKKIKKNLSYDRNPSESYSFREQLIYSLPIGVSSIFGVIGRQIDQYIVAYFFNPDSFAVYSRGAMRIPIISTIQFTIHNIMMPHYIKALDTGNVANFLARYHLCVEKVAKINFATFALLFSLSPTLISFLYTDEYIGAVPIFRAYLFFLLFNITSHGIIHKATAKTSGILYATILSILANIILSYLMVPLLGAIGAAIATMVCYCFGVCYYLITSCKIINIKVSEIFPWKFLVKYFSVSITASLPVYVISKLALTYYFNNFIVLTTGTFVYVYILILLSMRFRLFNEGDFATLSRWSGINVEKIFKKFAFLS